MAIDTRYALVQARLVDSYYVQQRKHELGQTNNNEILDYGLTPRARAKLCSRLLKFVSRRACHDLLDGHARPPGGYWSAAWFRPLSAGGYCRRAPRRKLPAPLIASIVVRRLAIFIISSRIYHELY